MASWISALAHLLAMPFEQEVGAGTGVKGCRDLRFDSLLGFPVGHTVIFALLPAQDSHEHVRAVGGNRGNRRNACEQQNSVCARIGDAGKLLERLANLGHWSGKACAQVAAKLVLNPDAIPSSRIALSSGTMPPGLSAPASLAVLAERSCAGSTPMDFFSDSQPFAQAASLAGYPQCHHTRKWYGSVGQPGSWLPCQNSSFRRISETPEAALRISRSNSISRSAERTLSVGGCTPSLPLR